MPVVKWDRAREYECEECRMPLWWRPGRRLWGHKVNYGGPHHFPVLPGQRGSVICSCGGPKSMLWRWCKACENNMEHGRNQVSMYSGNSSEARQDFENREHEDDQRVPSYPLDHSPHPPGEECGSCWVTHHGDVGCEVCENAWLSAMGLRHYPKEELSG